MKEIKKSSAKKVAPKAAPKAASGKKPVVKVAPKAAVQSKPVNPEQRYKMIEEAAYYIAERHGFNGDSAYFWSLAEAEINTKLN